MNPQDQPADSSEGRQDFNPGQTISPRTQEQSQQSAAAPLPPNAEAPSLPSPIENQLPQQPTASMQESPTQGLFKPEAEPLPQQPSYAPAYDSAPEPADISMQHSGSEVSWTASEFVVHEKSPMWYLAMIGGAALLSIIVYVITRDWFSTLVVIIAAAIFGVAAGRKPRQMQYAVDDHGVSIGRRFYPYGDFRSFSIAEDGPLRSVNFMPLKRFMPALSIYYDPADEQRIGEVLTAHLPMHEHKHDMTERLMRRMRF